jgi:hypothetical protein
MVSISPNTVSFRPLAAIKNMIVSPAPRNLRVAAGIFRGLRFELNLQHQTQFYFGLYETEISAAIRRSAPRCQWMVDVGAGGGELSLYFLKHTKCEQIYAFEPQSKEVALFRRNLALNNLQDSNRLVISDKFVGCGDPFTHLPIDDLQLSRLGKGFLKIDVDGFEVDVLDSAIQTLTRCDVDVLVEVHSEQLERECIQKLKSLRYEVEIIPNAWWRIFIPERRPVAHNRWILATRSSHAISD